MLEIRRIAFYFQLLLYSGRNTGLGLANVSKLGDILEEIIFYTLSLLGIGSLSPTRAPSAADLKLTRSLILWEAAPNTCTTLNKTLF